MLYFRHIKVIILNSLRQFGDDELDEFTTTQTETKMTKGDNSSIC